MPYRFLSSTRASLVWNTMVLVTVILPLSSLVFDVPQYYAAATNLEMALDAAAQGAANDCLQLAEFSESGQTRLDEGCVNSQALIRFNDLTEQMADFGHESRLTTVDCRDSCQTVFLQGTTAVRVFFSLSPEIAISRTASSKVRMTTGT